MIPLLHMVMPTKIVADTMENSKIGKYNDLVIVIHPCMRPIVIKNGMVIEGVLSMDKINKWTYTKKNLAAYVERFYKKTWSTVVKRYRK